MSANRFGNIFSFTTFGESHGPGIGVVIDGCPAGIEIVPEELQKCLDRRRPGKDPLQSSRQEPDLFEMISGVFKNKTLGTPIAVIIKNQNQRPDDYKEIEKNPRIGHADDVWKDKFGHSDPRGGGRSSGRETASRVIAGYFAKKCVEKSYSHSPISICAFAEKIGPIELEASELSKALALTSLNVDQFQSRFPSSHQAEKVKELLNTAKQKGESYGGWIRLLIHNPPPYLGQPVFHKLKADLTSAFMSIGAVSGVEFGSGFNSANSSGRNFHQTTSNGVYGGIRGGISTGEMIDFRIAFKPTASLSEVAKQGRHDPCIVPRAIPVLEAMAWAVLADHVLWKRLDRIET